MKGRAQSDLTAKERGIIFGPPMVRALLAGTKTQTRRVAKLPASPWPWEPELITCEGLLERDLKTPASFAPYPALTNTRSGKSVVCPYGAPGDRLWVRETWGVTHAPDGKGFLVSKYVYAADLSTDEAGTKKWCPSIFMPRAVSRITLEITDVRVERLKAISEEDARAEGILPAASSFTHGPPLSCRDVFARLWDTINGERAPWSSNPWVWALTFKRVSP